MLYLYDNAIVEDLYNSFNRDVIDNPVVKVIAPEQIIGLAAQIQNDEISFPIIALSRSDTPQIDSDRTNFTRMHKGICSVLDKETNTLYYEKAVPIKLSYKLTLLTTNTADRDELIKELIFKYVSMYFLTIKLPYESNRKLRFGISIPPGAEFSESSGNLDYIESGKLYQSIINLTCEGCVMLSYTPAKLTRVQLEPEVINPKNNNLI